MKALVHESESGTDFSPGLTNWLLHGERLWPAKFEHPIQNVARDQRFARWGLIGHSSPAIRDDEHGAGRR